MCVSMEHSYTGSGRASHISFFEKVRGSGAEVLPTGGSTDRSDREGCWSFDLEGS